LYDYFLTFYVLHLALEHTSGKLSVFSLEIYMN